MNFKYVGFLAREYPLAIKDVISTMPAPVRNCEMVYASAKGVPLRNSAMTIIGMAYIVRDHAVTI